MTRKFPEIGRHVFGVAAIVFGVSGLVWGDFAAPWHPVRPTVPYRTALAYIAAIVFLAGGLAVQWRRTTRAGLIALAVLYGLGALLWMPRVIGFPSLFGVWNGFAEEFAMVAAVLVAFAAARTDTAPWSLPVARILFGLCSLSFGIEHFTAIPQTASMVPAWLPPGQRFWAVATGTAMVLAGLSLISGILAAWAAWGLTTLMLLFEVVVWIPRVAANPGRQIPWAGNAITIAVAASACMVAEVLSRRALKVDAAPVR